MFCFVWGKSVGVHLPFLLGISHIMCLKAYEWGNAATYFNSNNKTNWARVAGVEGWYYWHHASFHTTQPHEIFSCLLTPPSSPCKAHFTHETESPWPLHFKHSHWWKRRVRSKFASHYAWGTTGVCECLMDVKSTWIPTWHPMDHASWSLGLFSINLLEVGLTQKRETMELRRLTIVDLFYFIMCEDPHE